MNAFPWRSVAAGLLASVVACGAQDETTQLAPVGGSTQVPAQAPPNKGTPDGGSSEPGTGAGGDDGQTEVCKRPLAVVPTEGLTACGDGKGHCYDKTKTPKAVTLTECNATQWCVPDAVFSAGGNPLAACESPYGAGVCGSTLIEEVADRAQDLSPDGCTNGDYCVPCLDPNTQQPTNACGPIGLYADECPAGSVADDAGPGALQNVPPVDAGPVQLPACCEYPDYGFGAYSGGTCVPSSQLSDAQQSAGIPQLTCATNFSCAPNELYAAGAGGGTFHGCYWEGDWFSDGNGVCVDRCFLTPQQLYDLDDNGIESGDCGPTQACVPCESAPAGTPGCF